MNPPAWARRGLGVVTAVLLVVGVAVAQRTSHEQADAAVEGVRLSTFSPSLATGEDRPPPPPSPSTTSVPGTTAPPVPPPPVPGTAAAPRSTGGPRPTTVPTGSPPRPSAGDRASSPTQPDCAQLPAGMTRSSLRGGRWLAKRVEGQTATHKVYVEALPCDIYDGEAGQISVHIDGAPGTFTYTVDYGDGTSWKQYPQELCQMVRPPVLLFGQGNRLGYARPGTYVVTVHLTAEPCPAPGVRPATPESVVLSIPVQRVAGPRPYPAPEVAISTGPPGGG